MSEAMTKKERDKHALEIHKIEAETIHKNALARIKDVTKARRGDPNEMIQSIRNILTLADIEIQASIIRYADRLNEITELYKK
jgi:multidrug resistance efflux pump